MTRPSSSLLVVFNASVLLFVGNASNAQTETGNELVLRGFAKTKSGQPLANATLFLFTMEEQEYPPGWGVRTQVKTNEKGEFEWHVPTDLKRQVEVETHADSSAPECYALPLEPGWEAVPSKAPAYEFKSWKRTVLEKLAPRCETKWITNDKTKVISVVAPDVGRAELKLRDPAGKPLNSKEVRLVVNRQFDQHAGATVFHGKTDRSGRLVWRGYSGLRMLRVLVPGVGFGSTGQFQLLPNRLVSAAVPPLAPFGRISGTVATELLKPGLTVRADDLASSDYSWHNPAAAVDNQGRFTLDELLPGDRRLKLDGGAPNSLISVRLAPGQTRTGVQFSPPRPVIVAGKGGEALPLRNAPPAKVTLKGKVTDIQGAGVGGVEVFAICSYFGAIRQYQEVLSATTESDGSYLIANVPGERVSVVAVQPQGPPAFAAIQPKPNADASQPASEISADLVLPAGHTHLTVQVMRAGQPAPNVWVCLSPQGGTGLFGADYMGSISGPASEKLRPLLIPVGKTNEQGEITFSDITPGRWNIIASTINDSRNLESLSTWWGESGWNVESNLGSTVDVQNGANNRFSLSLLPPPPPIPFHVEGPNGKPPQYPSLMFLSGIAALNSLGAQQAQVDAQGNGRDQVRRPGLWRVGTRFGETPEANTVEPFYESNSYAAVSAALPDAARVMLRSTRREAGRIKVELRNAQGRPMAGVVWFDSSFAPSQSAASVPAKEGAVFSDLISGSYNLLAWSPDVPQLPSLASNDAPFPTDAQLTDVRQFVPQTVAVTSGEEISVTFQPQPVGYIRGKIKVPDDTSNYSVYLPYSTPPEVRVRYDSRTGEYVAGPFTSKSVVIRAVSKPGDPQFRQQDFTFNLLPGKVLHADLEPKFDVPTPPPTNVRTMLTMGGVFNATTDGLPGAKVLLPDGKTPAWGAVASVFTPETWSPVRGGRTDALGNLSAVETWYTSDAPKTPPMGSPTEPVLVVSLPGSHGATIAPLKSAASASIVLPPAVSTRGRLTVDGRSLRGLPSEFRVVAAYQGKGKLNSFLSVSSTPDVDGNFELNGLTPGTYSVQAVRDNLWLSAPQTLVVENIALPELHFDIAPPGAATVVHFQNAKGKPLAGQPVTIERPNGPLTDALWPVTMTTDPHGDLYLNGLEAGQHRLRVEVGPSGKKAKEATAPLLLSVPELKPGTPVQNQTFVIPHAP